MKYTLFVDGVTGSYSKEIDTSVTPVATVGRVSKDNTPEIILQLPIISRRQGYFLVLDNKIMYENTGQIIPKVINGEKLDPTAKLTEMNLETILSFGDAFKISRQPLQQLETEASSGSDDPKTMAF